MSTPIEQAAVTLLLAVQQHPKLGDMVPPDVRVAVQALREAINSADEAPAPAAPREIVTVLSGGGWLIEWQGQTGPNGETRFVDPVVAWGIDVEGNGYPLHTDDKGILSPLMSDSVRVFHPDQSWQA